MRGQRDKFGRYLRTRNPWSLENFDDGYVDAGGRFRVYKPGHKRACKLGYILRSLVAYEAYHNIEIPDGYEIHHIDRVRTNDSKENLQMLSSEDHKKLHSSSRIKRVPRTCQHCKTEFLIKPHRLKDPSRGKYCGQKCYHGSKVA